MKTVTLFRNVDIIDLRAIVKDGILSMDACGNDNWETTRRANSPTDVVYLFSPSQPEKKNSFVQYGFVLLKVCVPEADVKEFKTSPYDINLGKYTEYVIKEVPPENITDVYIPRFLKDRVEQGLPRWNPETQEFDMIKVLPDREVIWCDVDISECDRPFTPERFRMFTETIPLSTTEFNYFRGIDERRRMIDINPDHIIYKL